MTIIEELNSNKISGLNEGEPAMNSLKRLARIAEDVRPEDVRPEDVKAES